MRQCESTFAVLPIHWHFHVNLPQNSYMHDGASIPVATTTPPTLHHLARSTIAHTGTPGTTFECKGHGNGGHGSRACAAHQNVPRSRSKQELLHQRQRQELLVSQLEMRVVQHIVKDAHAEKGGKSRDRNGLSSDGGPVAPGDARPQNKSPDPAEDDRRADVKFHRAVVQDGAVPDWCETEFGKLGPRIHSTAYSQARQRKERHEVDAAQYLHAPATSMETSTQCLYLLSHLIA